MSCSTHLTTNHPRPGIHITRWRRPIQLEQNPRVRGLVRAGKRDKRARVEGSRAAGDRELGACNVDLHAADRGRAVQRDVLDAQEVVAGGDAGGDGGCYGGFACGGQSVLVARYRKGQWG